VPTVASMRHASVMNPDQPVTTRGSAGLRSEQLQLIRARSGWKQSQLLLRLEDAGRGLGIHVAPRASLKTMVSKWENGAPMSEDYRRLFRHVYGMTDEDLGFESDASSPMREQHARAPRSGRGLGQAAPDTGLPIDQLLTLTDDEGIVVPCRARDGRIIFMVVPRRAFLTYLGMGAAVVAAAGDPPTFVSNEPGFLHNEHMSASDFAPAEHFRRFRKVLVESDNLFGSLSVVPTVEGQIKVMQRLRQSRRGQDARDLLRVQSQYAEFCGWLYQDSGDLRSAQYWTDRALEWSIATGEPDVTTYIIARKSQIAGDMGDARHSVDLAEVVTALARPRTRLAAIGATFAAYGRALAGEGLASQNLFDQALETYASLGEDPAHRWGSWLDDSYIEVYRARGLYALGDYKAANDGFRTAIATVPLAYRRDRGVYLAREALAVAAAGDPEEAAQVGVQALAVAEETGSARMVSELRMLYVRLERWRQEAKVVTFRQAFHRIVLDRQTLGHPLEEEINR
jgi:tetratricopeptide (TPR) repeat protein